MMENPGGKGMDPNSIRQTIQQVLAQARQDPAFKDKLMTDPYNTLRQAGLSPAAAKHMVQNEIFPIPEEPSSEGMAMRMMPIGDCDPLTCIITTCTWFTW